MNFTKHYYLVLISILALIGFSCEDFEDDQTIPSYIQVDTIILVDNPLVEEGALTHNFTDIWVYVNDQSIGMFELPTEQIPVLVEGNHTLELAAGIKRNGMSGTRGQYSFIKLLEIKDFTFIKDSIVQVIPVVQYVDNNIKFMWKENFEQGANSISLFPTLNSDTSLQIYQRENQQLGNAGAGFLTVDSPVLEVASPADPSSSLPGFKFPPLPTPLNPVDTIVNDIFVEIEFNTNIPMIVGIMMKEVGVSLISYPIVVINPTDGVWKKMYVNLTPRRDDMQKADYVYVYIRADYVIANDSPLVLIDNLKLIYNYYTIN